MERQKIHLIIIIINGCRVDSHTHACTNTPQVRTYARTHTHLHTQKLVASFWLGAHQGIPSAPTTKSKKNGASTKVYNKKQSCYDITGHLTHTADHHWVAEVESRCLFDMRWGMLFYIQHIDHQRSKNSSCSSANLEYTSSIVCNVIGVVRHFQAVILLWRLN